jgi:hypothetical protein
LCLFNANRILTQRMLFFFGLTLLTRELPHLHIFVITLDNISLTISKARVNRKCYRMQIFLRTNRSIL